MIKMEFFKVAIMPNADRDISVDIAKGIGIILVCYGHCKGTTFSYEVFAFHMPLFFMLSGFFLKQDSFKNFLYKKSRTLFIPFIFFYVFTLLMKVPFQLLTAREKDPIKGLMSGELFEIEKANSPLWFLVALMTALFLIWCVKRVFKNDSFQNVVYFGLALCGLFFGYTNITPPLYVAQACLAIPFIIIGNYFHHFVKHIHPFLLFIASLVVFCISFQFQNGKTNISTLTIDSNPLCFFIPALSGSFMIIGLSMMLAKFKKNKLIQVLAYLGKMSLFIMCLHENIRFGFVNKAIHFLPDVSWGLIETSYLVFGACLIGVIIKFGAPWLFDYKSKLNI